ncbi:hypothetical protein QWY75_01155 [Pontixanthobacter aestiaquae]|uniref:NADH-quinone oxidoreductase subunit E n=1 Tax=Pontixanthobacter aestiaquae TaxID=1509367 RepID=A0A844ZAG3_9SPHN|nr:hypothetical protein [Pontixanthobacter aestiaquae]MDN3644807.1 hypothetical protein [Pontixanthobacter aestiaquae]MXO84186.1 hypothetical protein [Pontixanthobacter aestiaquae]
MMELAQANWPLLVAALVIGLLAAWWIFVAMRRTKVDTDTSDVLDEGKGPANRNQALIDAPAAAETPPIAVPAAGIAGAGTAVAAATEHAVEAAKANADTSNEADDLTRIKGVGPKLKSLLISLGVTKFEQIANWTDAEIDEIDAQLGRFEGRIRRDNWMEQAKFLAADDTAGYEGKFGKL